MDASSTHGAPQPDSPLFHDGYPFDVATWLPPARDVAATPAQRANHQRYTRVGDPAADAVAAMVRRLPHGRWLFELAVEHGIDAVPDAPEELVAFFAEVDTEPFWHDRAQLDLACRVIARTGVIAGFTSLAMLSLMGGYQAWRIVKPLRNGDLDRMAARRIAETTAWLDDITTPGGLERFAAGTKSTLRIRLIHALVRAGMTRRPDWNDQWHHPLNESQVAGTLTAFWLGTLIGPQALGMQFTAREADAVAHLWRTVGRLLGISPNLLPTNSRDHARMLSMQGELEFGRPDQDSIHMARALATAIGPAVIGEGTDLISRTSRAAVTGFMAAYARKVLGQANADILGLDDSPTFQITVTAVATGIRALEYPRRLLPAVTRWQERHGHRTRTALTQRLIRLHHADRSYARHHGAPPTMPAGRNTAGQAPPVSAHPTTGGPGTTRAIQQVS
ncbi:oxygenase MpaB family protein [Nocardia tengchongensis]|uniref:oxygenase MpaB family protein n=1 Tax=Nocardia tengchongensis TaxID=2055889 RepID=UPI0036A1D67D